MALGDQPLHHQAHFGCLLIASPQGHSGKTIVTVGLCDVLKRRGLLIQPFKKGPDYIDPSWLTVAAGRSCRNLDLFLVPQEQMVPSFWQACQGADLALIEGAMGLYDGLDSHGTTSEIARLLNIPILLVVNTTRMTSSIAAMVTGYQNFEKDVQIAGVILNYVSGARHERKLKDAVEKYCNIPVVGSIPKNQDLRIIERHLGLIPSSESNEAESMVERIGRKLEPYLDLDRILAAAHTSEPDLRTHSPSFTPHPQRRQSGFGTPATSAVPSGPEALADRRSTEERERARDRKTGTIRIGIIRDRAFNFYYPENLEALVKEGAELIIINSFKDRLPHLDGLYIGGGFPELFLNELEGNRGLRQDVAQSVQMGLPAYAECAGLMYLCRSISWQNRCYEMVGVIDAEVQLSEKPEGHGYVVAEVIRENALFPVGLIIRGHEFHHSSLFHLKDLQFICQIRRGQGITGKSDGIVYKNLFASFFHLHALGTPEWAEGLISLASRERESAREFAGEG